MPTQTKAKRAGAEVRQLRACINDLIGVVALPAIWKGAAPSEIVRTLLDMLLGILDLDFVYLRPKDPTGESPFEVVRVAHSHAVTVQLEEIRELLKGWPEGHPQKLPQLVRKPFGDGELSIVPLPLGLGAEVGVLVAGSRRADFPVQTERLLLSVAANQATIGLQEAWLLSEQKDVADELDRRVAQQTQELAAANKELQNRERRIRRLVDANILAIFIWDLEGAIVEANEAFLRMLQYGREDVASRRVRWPDLTPPEWRECDEGALAELKTTGMVQPYEKEYFRKDGSRVPVLVAGALFEEGGGEGVAFALDLSAQKRAEAALRRSETYLTEAQMVTHTGSCAVDGTSREILYWSDEMFRLFGFDPEQGLPMWDQWMQRIHPEDRDRFRTAGDKMFLERVHCDVEFRIVTPDGTVKHIHGIGHPVLSPSGELGQVVGTMVDVTERKREEEERERLREAQRVVVETAPEAVVSADESGAIQFANPATMRVFGYDPKELIGKPLTVLMPEYMRKLHENGFRRYLATGQRHLNWQGTELTGMRKNGQDFPVEVSFGELTMNRHRVFTGFVRDISARKRAEQALQEAQAELTHVTRLTTMGELAASIAHEINQPLAAIVANGEACLRWLKADPANVDEARESARKIIRDGSRAGEVIKGIRGLARKSALQLAPLSVNELIEEVIALTHGEIQRNRVLLKTELTPDLPAVLGDRVQLEQVVLNLILNGMEAMSEVAPEQRSLVVGSGRSDANGVVAYLRDCGTGISAEAMQSIFKPFFTTKPGGTGMGLSISRSIVEAHGGRLWAAPNDDRGMTFSFSIPGVAR